MKRGFSLRNKLVSMGVDPAPHLAIAHNLLTSGVRVDIRRYNPRHPMVNNPSA